jgi:ubiquinone/menaquinone biosynthesis C-methylase UbiE
MSKEATRTNYNRLSRWYDLLAGSWEKKFRESGIEKIGLEHDNSVLEIGFGTGHGLLDLAGVVSHGHVFGLDISDGMCRQSQKRILKAGLGERIGLVLGDGVHLPLQDESIDAVFLCFTLELFETPEIPLVLSECARILRPGKRLGVVAMSKAGKTGWILRLYEWAHRTFPRTLDCRPIFTSKVLQETGFRVLDVTLLKRMGFAVEIVVAKKK